MDYKELLNRLYDHSQSLAAYNDQSLSYALEDAIAAIETLLAERDAAVAELDRIAEFTETEFLDYLNNTIHHECGYNYYCYLFDLLCQVTHWEYDDKWRGPQKEGSS